MMMCAEEKSRSKPQKKEKTATLTCDYFSTYYSEPLVRMAKRENERKWERFRTLGRETAMLKTFKQETPSSASLYPKVAAHRSEAEKEKEKKDKDQKQVQKEVQQKEQVLKEKEEERKKKEEEKKEVRKKEEEERKKEEQQQKEKEEQEKEKEEEEEEGKKRALSVEAMDYGLVAPVVDLLSWQGVKEPSSACLYPKVPTQDMEAEREEEEEQGLQKEKEKKQKEKEQKEKEGTKERVVSEADESGVIAPVVDPTNWQRGKTVLACNQHMLEKQLACDVWFRLGAQRQEGGCGGGWGDTGERVGAHAYVLRSRSRQFDVLLAESERRKGGQGGGVRDEVTEEDVIDMPYTRPEVFWQLLRYLYYEYLKLEEDTALELLTLAETYDVSTLRDACLRFLHRCLAVGTACSILEAAHRCRDQRLTSSCLAFVREHGHHILSSSSIGDLCRECLNKVLTLEGLGLSASEQQEAADRWASLQCQNRLLESTVDNKHITLGDVLYVKKDLQQSRRFFSQNSARPERHGKTRGKPSSSSGRRTSRQDLDDFSLASFSSTRSGTSSVSSFSGRSTKSSELGTPTSLPILSSGWDLHQVTRFLQFSDSEFVPNNGSADAVSFSVDRDILLYGFGIYGPGDQVTAQGPSTSATYRVDTVISKKKKDLLLESIVVTGAGVVLPVMLDKEVRLKKEKTYILAVYIHGPPSLSGVAGRSAVRGEEGAGESGRGDGARFSFCQAKPPVKGNRTGVRTGQLPRLYYLPC